MNGSNSRWSRLRQRLIHGIATKIVLMALVVVFIPVYWLNREAVTFFDRFSRQALESNMRHFAVIIGSQYRQMLTEEGHLPAAAAAVLAGQIVEYDRRIGIHVRILDSRGDVLLDSRGSPEKNLMEYREVRQSLSGGYAMRNALTPDRQFMNYYLAWPVKSDDRSRILGVVHIVQDTNPVIRAIKRMIERQRIATWVALAVAALIAVVLAGGITRPLLRLTQGALAFARKETRFRSALKRRRDEIGQLDEALQRMADEISDRNSYNREFVDTLRHELQSALAGISGSVDLLNCGAKDDPADCARFIEVIALQVRRMLNLSQQLGILMELGVESLRDRKQRVDLAALVKEAVDELAPLLPEPHARIEISTPKTPVEVDVVPELMTLVVVNLLKNALRHTPADGGIDLRVSQDQGVPALSVRDTGEGISEDNLPRVFERFFTTVPKNRVDSTGTGLGLGLAIVKQIIDEHDGVIRCESVRGRGAEFTITFHNLSHL